VQLVASIFFGITGRCNPACPPGDLTWHVPVLYPSKGLQGILNFPWFWSNFMNRQSNNRLSGIDTAWSVVRDAHAGSKTTAKEAQEELLLRYGGAIRRYLVAALRNEEMAHEVFQEFALRFVRGDFHSADPALGKFRDFVKRILSNMIVDYQRGLQREVAVRSLPDGAAMAENPRDDHLDRELVNSWREEVFARCWALLDEQERSGGNPVYTALCLRVENETARSEVLAVKLESCTGKHFSVGAFRVLLHRARTLFANLVIDDVVQSLATVSEEEVERELIELNLLGYCRNALRRRFGGGDAVDSPP